MVWRLLVCVASLCILNHHHWDHQRTFLAPQCEEATPAGSDLHQGGVSTGFGSAEEKSHQTCDLSFESTSFLGLAITSEINSSGNDDVVLQSMLDQQFDAAGQLPQMSTALDQDLDATSQKAVQKQCCQEGKIQARERATARQRAGSRGLECVYRSGPMDPKYPTIQNPCSETTRCPTWWPRAGLAPGSDSTGTTYGNSGWNAGGASLECQGEQDPRTLESIARNGCRAYRRAESTACVSGKEREAPECDPGGYPWPSQQAQETQTTSRCCRWSSEISRSGMAEVRPQYIQENKKFMKTCTGNVVKTWYRSTWPRRRNARPSNRQSVQRLPQCSSARRR